MGSSSASNAPAPALPDADALTFLFNVGHTRR